MNVIPKGNGHWCICPFHSDNNPSLSISVEKNIWKCFSCNASGDAIGFVMRIEKCDYREAILKIGEILNIDTNKYLNSSDSKKNDLYKLNQHVAEIYHKYLFDNTKESKIALDYLQKTRKLTKESIEKYKIGFAPSENILEKVIKVYGEKNKVTEELIRESKLFTEDEKLNRKSFFRKRIIFPIWNEKNKITGFCGRGETPKYLNLKNNLVFSKTNTIFGIHNLQQKDPIYLFEGFLDLIKTEQELKISNGIACMGGILGEDCAKKLKKYSKKIVLCLDNDDPGKSFTVETGKKLISHGFEVSVIDFLGKKEKDIDEMIDKDAKDTKKRMDNPVGFFGWIYKNQSPKNLDSTKLLAEECLEAFIDGKTGNLKYDMTLDHAKNLIEEIFGWYLNTPEHKEIDLTEKINVEKKKYIDNIYRSSIGKKHEQRKYNESVEQNDFIKLAIKYQNLPSFIKSDHLKEWSGYRKFEWEYVMDEGLKLENKEIEWIFTNLKNNKNNDEKPETLKKYESNAIKIKNDSDFFNKYYSFYHEYFQKLSNFYIKNNLISVDIKMQKLFQIREAILKLEEISSKFFLNSDFYAKN